MRRRSIGMALAVGAVALGLGGRPAKAQDYKGTFRLDERVRWGQAVLPPGDYTIVLHSIERGSIATIRGPHKTIMVMANGANQDASTKVSSLSLVGDRTTPSVRALHLAESGVDLYYPVGKRALELEALNRQEALSVPVFVRGK